MVSFLCGCWPVSDAVMLSCSDNSCEGVFYVAVGLAVSKSIEFNPKMVYKYGKC